MNRERRAKQCTKTWKDKRKEVQTRFVIVKNKKKKKRKEKEDTDNNKCDNDNNDFKSGN